MFLASNCLPMRFPQGNHKSRTACQVTIFQGSFLAINLMAAIVSAMVGAVIWLFIDQLLPFIFILSPFFLLLSIPVSLPILVCWRHLGAKSALWTASLAALFLFMAVPSAFAFFLILQLIIPAAFISFIANLREHPLSETFFEKSIFSFSKNIPEQKIGTVARINQNKAPSGKGENFIPLSTILSSTTLLVVIANLILAAFLNNTPQIASLLDASISEMIRILTIMRTLSPSQIIQLDMLMRADNYALITRVFALYSFFVVFLNFYIASRLKRPSVGTHRPRDFWPYNVAPLPRTQIVLLVGASLVSLLPINVTLQNCLDTLIMVLMLSFTLAGLGAIHLMTHGKTWRPLLLCTIYGLLLPLSASFVLAFWGIFVSSTSLLQRYKNNTQPSL